MPTTAINIRRSGFTLTELAFVIVIICICILLLTPFIKDIRSKAKLAACEENLEKISLALKLYASEHEENFPANLEELTKGGYLESGASLDYHYVTGYTVLSPSDSTIVFDKDERHRGERHVLHVSGDIERTN